MSVHEDQPGLSTPSIAYARHAINSSVFVNKGTAPGVRGEDTEPFHATVTKILAGGYEVLKTSTNRKSFAPEWAVLSSKSFGSTPISADSRPTLRRLSSKSKTKLMNDARRETQTYIEGLERKILRIRDVYRATEASAAKMHTRQVNALMRQHARDIDHLSRDLGRELAEKQVEAEILEVSLRRLYKLHRIISL